jgi:hypothetical protein
MTDLLLVVAMVAAFAALAGFVAVCAHVIGPDPEGVELSSGPDVVVDDAVEVAA